MELRRAFCSAGVGTTTSVSGVPPPAPVFIPIALPASAHAAAGPARRSGMIEIELAGGRHIRVDAAVDIGVLKRVVDALEGR